MGTCSVGTTEKKRKNNILKSLTFQHVLLGPLEKRRRRRRKKERERKKKKLEKKSEKFSKSHFLIVLIKKATFWELTTVDNG